MRIPSASLAMRMAPITPDDKSSAVTIVTWSLLIAIVVMFVSREAIKFAVMRRFHIDDLLIGLATLFAAGLSVTFLILSAHGLGRSGALELPRAITIMKAYYASDFLYIASICFAKLSLVAFFYNISIKKSHRRLVQGLCLFIIIWSVGSTVAVAFQCGLPKPWEILTLRCYNTGIFWIVYCIIDMTTDLGIIMLSVNLVAYLRVKFSRKAMVVACFAPRLLVIGAALARLIFLYPVTPHDHPAFKLWIPVICTQVQVCLAISTACIPFMKPFFEGAEAGAWRADYLRRKGIKVDDFYGYGSPSFSRSKSKGKMTYSEDSTTGTTPKLSDTSPQIPAPEPLSPLITPIPPNLDDTPPNSIASHASSPSKRGLRLHIPPPEVRPRNSFLSPQTASSHALSPECLSPRPLLSPDAYLPTLPAKKYVPVPPPKEPRPLISSSHYGSPEPDNGSPPPSLHALSPPVAGPVYPRPPSSLYSQSTYIPQTPPPMPHIEISPSNNSSKHSSLNRASQILPKYTYIPPAQNYSVPPPMKRSQSPNPQHPAMERIRGRTPTLKSFNRLSIPIEAPSPSSSSRSPTIRSFKNLSVPKQQPSSGITVATNKSPAPWQSKNLLVPSQSRSRSRTPSPNPPKMYSSEPWSSRPASRQQIPPPPKFVDIPLDDSPGETIPSYYLNEQHTPPQPHQASPPQAYPRSPPTQMHALTTPQQFHRSPPQIYPAPLSPRSPTSPNRLRNNHIINPQNSSRKDQMSPVSPPTPLSFWKDENEGHDKAGLGLQGPVIRELRSSPRLVVREF